MNPSQKALSKAKLGHLILKNRIIKAGCFEGMSQDGRVTEALVKHHSDMAKGGVAMTTVAYCSVSADGLAYGHEMHIKKSLIPELKALTRSVHDEDCYASIQLGHCGYFASKKVIKKRPMGASVKFNLFRFSICRKMSKKDINDKIRDFVQAAEIAVKSGFDALEIHAGHGYLLSQFISPYTNKRRDEYGGSIENRMRFPCEVLRQIRNKIGPDVPILVKMNLTDGVKSGLNLEEAIEVAKAFERAGASALVPSSGFTSKTPFMMLRGHVPVKEMVANQVNLLIKLGLTLFGKIMVKEYKYMPLFHFSQTKEVKRVVDIPLIYIGGVTTTQEITKVIESGFDFVQVGRALIHDNEFVKKMYNNELVDEVCDACNRCVAAMDGGGVYCVSKRMGYM